jgi:ABC-type lipoprotein export system ATPase subunit
MERQTTRKLLENRPDNQSGGDALGMAATRALARELDVILEDEPTGNPGSNLKRDVVEFLTRPADESGGRVDMALHDESILDVTYQAFRATGWFPGDTTRRPVLKLIDFTDSLEGKTLR